MTFKQRLTEDRVRAICEDIERGDRTDIIAKNHNISPSYVSHIRCGRAYKEISENYNITRNRDEFGRTNRMVVHNICKALEKNEPLSRIARDNNVRMEVITRIRRGVSFTDISSRYNIRKEINKPKLDEETVHTICSMIDAGCGNTQIMRELGIERGKIESIKYGRAHKRISKDYNFMKKQTGRD